MKKGFNRILLFYYSIDSESLSRWRWIFNKFFRYFEQRCTRQCDSVGQKFSINFGTNPGRIWHFRLFFSRSRPETRLHSYISTQLFLQSRPLHENSQEILMMQCHAIKRGLWSPTRRTCLRPSIYNSRSKIKFTDRRKCELFQSKEKKKKKKNWSL